MMQKLMEINDELVRVREERDRLQSERDQAVENAARLHAELYATRKQLQDVCSVKPAGQSDLVRDVSHYIEAAEVDRPTEPQFKPYTFAAYIVGDKSQPDALRIVWATEEWVKHAEFSIVHRMKDMQFSGNDTFTPDQFSVNLKIQ